LISALHRFVTSIENLARTLSCSDVIGNESRSAERCARKIAQDETPLVVGQFTSDGDSAASVLV
jgi:hypothetical protein